MSSSASELDQTHQTLEIAGPMANGLSMGDERWCRTAARRAATTIMVRRYTCRALLVHTGSY